MKEHNGFYNKLKSHGVTMYAVAKAGGWSWQQVACWAKGTRIPNLATFKLLQRIMEDFGIEIDVDDFGKGGEQLRTTSGFCGREAEKTAARNAES